MQTITPIKIGWKWLGETINKLIDGINSRTPIQGDAILFEESATGVKISLDVAQIQAFINAAVAAAAAAAAAARAAAGGTGGSGGGSGGSSGGGGTGGDQSGSGDGAGYDVTAPVGLGDGLSSIYPNQYDLTNDIVSIVITRSYGGGLFADAVSIPPGGTFVGITSGPPSFIPFPGPYVFSFKYNYADGSHTFGPDSPPVTIPSGGVNIIMGSNPFSIPR